jgi:glycosyltransferase involved in cell wall biosynthesis
MILVSVSIMIVSIITVVYNNFEYIRDAMESVFSQDYPLIEYIVIDGGSTDGTLDIVDEYRERISVFLSEPDDGIYDALNKGIRLATGDVIGFLHSDDLFAGRNVVTDVAKIFSEQGSDVVYGDLNYVMKDSQSTVVRHWHAGVFSRNKLRYGWMPPHPSFYVRRELYIRLRGFDLSYRIAADYDSMLRILCNDAVQLVYIPQVLVKMRMGGVSNRSITNIIRKSIEDYRILRSNHIGGVGALLCKNFSKLSQFIT